MSASAGTAQRRGSNSGTIAAVRELKEALTKELSRSTGAFSTERCLDVLRRLDDMPVNLAVLSETLIGTTVSKLKAHSDEELASASKALVKKWKKLAKESGVGATAQNGSNKGGEVKKQTPQKVAQSQPRRPSDPSKSAASTAAAGSIPEEWSDLPPLRKNIRIKMREMLLMSVGDSEDFSADLCNQRAEEVEKAMQSQSRGEKSAYTEKARKLGFNLKKNGDLRSNILSGHVQPDKLVTMSNDELATSAKAQARATLVENLNESRRLDWEQANEDKINEMCGIKGDLLKASLFTCSRCKSHKTTSTQKQTRSADEPMTVFVLCTNCGNRWKC